MLNADKTEIMCFNHARTSDHQFRFSYCNQVYTISSVERLKINGILFMQDQRRRETANVVKTVEAMERFLRMWSTRQLTLLGKILVIKTFAVSQSIYLMQSITLSAGSLKSIEKLIYKFLWNKNFNTAKAPDRIKRCIMETPTVDGGFGMINIRALNDSLDLRSYARLLKSEHPFFKQIKSCLNVRDPFNVKIDVRVDGKMECAIKALNKNRTKILNLACDSFLANANLVKLVNQFRIKNFFSAAGCNSMQFFMAYRRNRNLTVTGLTTHEFTNLERYAKYPQLNPVVKALILNGHNPPGNATIPELFLIRNSTIVSICSLNSKALRLNQIAEEDSMICVYKSGLILDPGELKAWTRQMRRLTSTRHKNVLLRVAHGDVFSNERLFRFGLTDSPNCSNCNEQSESPEHRVLTCPTARRAWELLDAVKIRLGLSQLADHSLENLLGARDKLSKIELALQAELLHKIISKGTGYNPERLVAATVKVISYSERLEPQLGERFKNEINAGRRL